MSTVIAAPWEALTTSLNTRASAGASTDTGDAGQPADGRGTITAAWSPVSSARGGDRPEDIGLLPTSLSPPPLPSRRAPTSVFGGLIALHAADAAIKAAGKCGSGRTT